MRRMVKLSVGQMSRDQNGERQFETQTLFRSEHPSGARPGHRGPEPPVAGGREAPDGRGEEREGGGAEQAQDPATPGGHEGQVQDAAAEVSWTGFDVCVMIAHLHQYRRLVMAQHSERMNS